MSKAISVSNLSKTYKIHKKEPGFRGTLKSFINRKYETVTAVKDVSFEINEGELIGFIGPNGAGKTTTLKCLSGLLYPSNGAVQVLGHTPFKRDTNFLKKIALVMGQKNQLWWDLPPTETFLLNKEIYGIPDRRYKETLNDLVELLDVKDVLNTQVRKLSLGQRMKCELIAALLHSPKVLFLDEPTIGLDVVMQKKLRDFIKAYNTKYNATIILTSHYMEDVRQLCERVIVIDHGVILFDGKLDNLIKEHTQHKFITVLFEKDVTREALSKLGKIQEFEFPKAVISVKRTEVNKVTTELLKSFPVIDLNIEEPDIEDIIREVFSKK
ncbi:MAG: ATP-binding cassette domain-containing protein [Candidatus Levybacteria bacterium]|nr:ATP-binding cassette domain-containing protein [Candidatus Levybacteria bacterium]